MIKARIEETSKKDELWLFIDRIKSKKFVADDLKEYLGIRDEDKAGNVAYAFLRDELKVVRDAIDKFLSKKTYKKTTSTTTQKDFKRKEKI